ncbi:transaldolase [Trichocoleus sp. DQ-A3]|uniref:transaldolase family protein n=1 Tax=Cyanophyceae TaxID=3028117 RepID=UPI001682FC59|nr:transaldolase family protein [Coleofasciculus sp. FACHB-125]MBD1899432.1 transaldolase [Coleofasciculus sp. FACHB-125]
MNLLQSLRRYGQSVWLDGFERGWISSDELQQYIEEDGLRGVRANFHSLKVAIESQEYDRDFTILAQQGMNRTAQSDYDYLVVRDLQLAADLLKQVHTQTQGRDGYVQIDLPPDALFASETAIAAAQKIWQTVGWSNLLLRIPATRLMLPIIEQLIGDRINVNATLVFSPNVYKQIFDGYLKGLERLLQQGESVSEVVCFTSVSIGCLDAAIDPLIASAETSFGIMQARLLYQHYRMLCESEHWRSLPEGVKPLRLVWDCTDIPPKSAWRYLQTLAAPETVMTLSPSTLEMYREVSLLPTSLIDDKSTEQILESKSRMEISFDERINQLVNEDIARSLNAFSQLLEAIDHKRMR